MTDSTTAAQPGMAAQDIVLCLENAAQDPLNRGRVLKYPVARS